MFRNRSLGLVVVLAVLAMVTLIFGTGVATLSDVPSGEPVTVVDRAQPKRYAELKESQLEQRDAQQFGSASIIVVAEEDSYQAMQKEQRAIQKEQRAASEAAPNAESAAVGAVRGEDYFALKDAQLDRDDARLGASISRAATAGWIYHFDALQNKWFAYHYSTTGTGPVIDDSFEIQGKPEGSANRCRPHRDEIDC